MCFLSLPLPRRVLFLPDLVPGLWRGHGSLGVPVASLGGPQGGGTPAFPSSLLRCRHAKLTSPGIPSVPLGDSLPGGSGIPSCFQRAGSWRLGVQCDGDGDLQACGAAVQWGLAGSQGCQAFQRHQTGPGCIPASPRSPGQLLFQPGSEGSCLHGT